MKMPRTSALAAAIALSVYGSSAYPQSATPPTAQPPAGQPPIARAAQGVAGPTDEALTKAIYSALEADPNHYYRHVTVRVDKGVATLGGFVHSSSAVYRARTIASKVPGVTHVVTSNLSLEPNRPR